MSSIQIQQSPYKIKNMLLLYIILCAIFPSLKTEIQSTKKQSLFKKKIL